MIPREVLRRTGADFGIVGDGERSVVRLIAAGRDEERLADIPRLVRWQNTRIVVQAPAWGALDGEPLLPRQTLDYPRYFREGGQGNVETKRGCPGRCIYCTDAHSKGRRCRLRPPAVVADEIERLLDLGIDWLHLCDSEFNLPPAHAEAVCEELISRKLGQRVHWYAYLAPQPFSAHLAALMKEAGCAGIDFGLDSGDARILENLGREYSPEQALETARICRDVGIIFMLDLLVGGPGETKQSVATTFEFARQCQPSCVGIALGVRIYADTKLAQMVTRSGLEANANLHGPLADNPDFLEPVFYLSRELGTVEEAAAHVTALIGNDERFFFGGSPEQQRDYDYDDNLLLVEAIASGARGAYWDILRRLRLKHGVA